MLKKYINCPFCNLKKNKYWYTYGQFDSDLNSYPIYKCISCKSASVIPAPTKGFLENFYKSEQNSMQKNINKKSVKQKLEEVLLQENEFPNSTIDSQRIINNLKKITDGKDFLDVGAGYGFFSNEAQKAKFNVRALELNSSVRDIFKLLNNFEAENINFDEEFVKINNQKFDIVLLSQVLEHIPLKLNPIKNIYNTLKPNGICVIAVPHFGSTFSILQGKKDMFIDPPEHVNFFSINGLNNIFKRNGFELVKIETVSRVNKKKIASRFKIFSLIINLALTLFIKLSDKINKGMYIQAYYKKIMLYTTNDKI